MCYCCKNKYYYVDRTSCNEAEQNDEAETNMDITEATTTPIYNTPQYITYVCASRQRLFGASIASSKWSHSSFATERLCTLASINL